MNESLYKYLLILGDNSMILGHRLSELCGHGPTLETDIALTNISLDLFGQVRSCFQYAAELKGGEATEDTIGFLRTEREHYNCILVEQPNIDFAHVITRQYFFDVFQNLQLQQLTQSNDEIINAIAHKSIKEAKYHQRFSGEWMKRLGDGTEESHQKMQTAVDTLYPYVHEFFQETETERVMREKGIGADLKKLMPLFYEQVEENLNQATLTLPKTQQRYAKGKEGIHTEEMGYILPDFQYMQRTYPNMQW